MKIISKLLVTMEYFMYLCTINDKQSIKMKQQTNKKGFLLPSDYCAKNGYKLKDGKLCFSISTKKYFALNYCSTDWETVDKFRLNGIKVKLYNDFNSFDKNGLPVFRLTEKIKLVDLFE